MKNFIQRPLLLVAMLGMLAAVYVACSKEDSSEQHPPNSAPTCADGIQNQGEFHVDCGGPCEKCKLFPSMTATIDSFWLDTSLWVNGHWEADTMAGVQSGNSLFIIGVDTIKFTSITFTHTQGFQRGVYVYDDIDGMTFGCDLTDGIVEISAFDTVQQTVSGFFSFNCLGFSSGKKERVINGKFEDITYYK